MRYADLADRTARLAAGLAGLGVGRGDRVAYLGLNDIATFEALFASGSLGAIFVPLNHRLAAAEIEGLLADCRPRVLVVGPGVDALAGQVRERVPGLAALTMEDWEALAATDPLPEPRTVELDDPALLLFTSGTTGRPKGAMLTHGNLTWNTMNQLAHLDVLGTDHALCLAPLFHAVGLGQVTLPVLFKGGTIEVVPRFDAGEVLRLIETLSIASFSCVPTMLQLMTEHPDWPRRDLSSLRHVLYGGSPAVASVVAAWRERGVHLQQGYGMTECAPGVMMSPARSAADRPAHVGVPHFFTDVAALGADGAPAPIVAGEPVELVVRGPHVFTGYWERPEETAEVLRDGWYRTGDVLVHDDDGWARVVDRTKDLVISGGENVYPAEIETRLLEVPGVRGAVLVGRPDDRWGEVGVAFVEPTDDAAGRALDAGSLREHLLAGLARFKVPAEIRVVTELPRNASGKALRGPLREQARYVDVPEEIL